MKTTDGMLALVIARDAQARLSEGELSDQAEIAQGLNDKQSKLRDVKKALRKALSDDNLDPDEMKQIIDAADAAGIGDEIRGHVNEIFKASAAGRHHAESPHNTAPYASAETYVAFRDEQAKIGQTPNRSGNVRIDETSDDDGDKSRAKKVDAIRDAISEALDEVKGEASGQELELQMASQEYSRATQLASNLLNVRNEVLKSLVQAIRA